MLKLKIVNSKTPNDSQVLEISPETMSHQECLVGRSRHCGIILPGNEVSRVHASIGLENGAYYFADLASLGGSRLNHDEVQVNQRYPLQPQDILRMGEFILTVETISQIETPPPSDEDATRSTPSADQPATTSVAATTTTPTQGFVLPGPELNPNPGPGADPKMFMPVSQVPFTQMGHWTKGDLQVRCAAIIDETHDVKTFRFVADPPLLFDYQPGQFVTLKLDINGKPIKRSYSISSTPSRPHTLEITVKRVPAPRNQPDIPPGLVSNWLHDNIQVGSPLTLAGPLGKFTCFKNPSPKLLLISAGSGITPMMSMSRWMLDTAADCDIVFFHNARSPEDIIFSKELEWMSSHNPNFKLAIATTRPAPYQPWWGLTGRLDEPMVYTIAPDFWQRTVYVCGPNGFMKAVKTMLQGLKFPMENYYEESFGGPKKSKKPATTVAAAAVTPPSDSVTPKVPESLSAPPQTPTAISQPSASAPSISPTAPATKPNTVTFQTSGKSISGDDETSILEIAEESDIEIDSSCRSGVCGSCKVKKIKGNIRYDGEPDALEEDEQEAGYILTCIAYPAGTVTVEA